ncbi:hypothetical protein T484DRAFT_1818600, partial [Baffinella frigidus]
MDVLEFLLSHDPTLVNAKGGGGATALHIVAGRDPPDEKTLNLLLAAELESRKRRGAALCIVAGRDPPDEKTLNLLLAAGADATMEDSSGVTPLDMAELRSDQVLNHPHAAMIRRHLGIPEAPAAPK